MGSEDASAGIVLDLRGMPCALRHAVIFEEFDALEAGHAFQILNDHDPAPLRAHFESRALTGYGWEYLQAGPDIWRVRVTRT
ncbi:MAG: DUF2249 domain-containing protein [Pseudomonadota bacterium]